MELWFLNGLLIGLVASFAAAHHINSKKLNEKTQAVSDSLAEMLKSVVDSHNHLNQTISLMDKRITETSLRVDGLRSAKVMTTSRFPSMTNNV